jgi:hypothetical protein
LIRFRKIDLAGPAWFVYQQPHRRLEIHTEIEQIPNAFEIGFGFLGEHACGDRDLRDSITLEIEAAR